MVPVDDDDVRSAHETEVWRVLFMILVGTLVGVLGWGIHVVTGSIDSVSNKQDAFLVNFQSYVLTMEKRVTTLEDYQRVQDASRQRLEAEFEQYRHDHDGERRR